MVNFLSMIAARIAFAVYLAGSLLIFFLRDTLPGRLLLCAVIAAVFLKLFVFQPLPKIIPASASQTLVVPAGANFSQVADSLERQGLLSHKRIFVLLGKLSGMEHEIRAGKFRVPGNLNIWQLLQYMKQMPAERIRITFPEGITASRMAAIVQQRAGIDSSAFASLAYDSAFSRSLLGEETSLEGYLLPETYFFEWGVTPRAILQQMTFNTLRIFEPDSIQQQMKRLGLSRRQVITLASIIEGEVLVDSERVIVSSLYHNRLKLGRPLQADPTLQYAIPGPPRRLLHKDLQFESPYNTYKYRGLPPGPINNPGEKSILAALYPAQTDFLYMVAAGDGTHRFSRTLKEHNYWHGKLNQLRRRLRAERRRKAAQNAATQ